MVTIRDRTGPVNLPIFGLDLFACKFNDLFHCPNFDPSAGAECDPVFGSAEAFYARVSPDFAPIGNFVDTEIFLFVADDKVLVVQRVKLLVVTAWRSQHLPNGFRFAESITANVPDIATDPVPFVLRDEYRERAVGVRFDLHTSLWFSEVKGKQPRRVVLLRDLHQDVVVAERDQSFEFSR